MVRRTYATRKRRLNLIAVSYITRDWVLNYLKMRQFERFYGGLGRFPLNSYASSADVFNLCSSNINASGINVISCAKNILSRFRKKSQHNHVLYDFTSNSRNTQLQFTAITTMVDAENVFPNVVKYEESGYVYDELMPNNLSQIYTHFNPMNSITQKQTLQLIANYYRIITLATLYNTQINSVIK